jgi:hypothetical protein
VCPKQITIGNKVHVYNSTILWQVYNESVKYGDTAYTWELSSREQSAIQIPLSNIASWIILLKVQHMTLSPLPNTT